MFDSHFRFPSIAGLPHVYFAHSDFQTLWSSAYNTRGALSPHLGYAHTYGDGQTQHEPERALTSADPVMVADYLASFAAHITETPLSVDQRRDLQHVWSDLPSAERIAFALSVRHKDSGPARFFNLNDMKISSRASLAHDKRWHKITQDHDGSIKSAVWILGTRDTDRTQGFTWFLDRWRVTEAVRTAYVAKVRWVPAVEYEIFNLGPATPHVVSGDHQSELAADLSFALGMMKASMAALVAQWEAERLIWVARERLKQVARQNEKTSEGEAQS